MAAFNRGSRSGGGRGFERRGFSDRGSRGPVEMHQAVCDKCRQNCEVPFRPTSGKPIYCSNCFEGKRGSESRLTNFEEGRSFRSDDSRRMFDATCDECKNNCQVPFQPSSGKPVYCSNCFGEKKNSGGRNNESSQCPCQEQCEALNSKLDKILALLSPEAAVPEAAIVEETPVLEVEEVKVAKKKPSKKKS